MTKDEEHEYKDFKDQPRPVQIYASLIFFFSTVVGVAWVTCIVYLGIYCIDNPNAKAVYGIAPDGTETLYPSEEDAENKEAADVTNVHGRFETWFIWGFVQDAAIIGYMLIYLVV